MIFKMHLTKRKYIFLKMYMNEIYENDKEKITFGFVLPKNSISKLECNKKNQQYQAIIGSLNIISLNNDNHS